MALIYVMPGWWLWAAVVFAVVAALSYWKVVVGPHPYFTRRLRLGLWTLRLLAALFVLLCLLDWRRETKRETTEKPMLQVLVDRSASMAVRDGSGGRSRYEESIDQLNQVVKPAWGDASRLETDFAGDGLTQGDPAVVKPDGTRSALGKSLREALESHSHEALGGVILMTDGAANDEEKLREAARFYRSARVPIFPWVTGTSKQPDDLRIVSAGLRQPSPSQSTVHLDLVAESPGYAGKDTTLVIRFGAQVLHQQRVHLNGGRQPVAVDFLSPYRGFHFYDVELAAMEGEGNILNNRARAACDLRRDPIRVLYMEGSEPGETTFLRDALETDPEMEITCLHYPQQYSQEVRAKEATELRGKDSRIFQDFKGRAVPSVCHPTRGFPMKLEDLLKYDVVINSDIIKEAFSPEQLAATVAFVEEFGGGFVMVGGQTSFGAGGYEKTVIDKLMPIEIANRSDPIWTSFMVKVTEAGAAHPIMQVGQNPAETKAAWTQYFPGFGGINYARRAKPGAHVIARTSVPGGEMDDLVLFAVQQIGRGRTMAFMSDTTAGWGSSFETMWGPTRQDPVYYRKFWNNTIRWLAADRIARKGGQAVVEIPPDAVSPGDVMEIRVSALSASELAGLDLIVREADWEPRTVPVQWDSVNRRWEGSFAPTRSGELTIEANYKNAEGMPVTTRSGVVVREGGDETVAVATRPALMEEIARESGGMVLTAGNVSKVLVDLSSHSVPVTWKRAMPLWDHWWVMVPLLFVVVAEWLLRRQREPSRRG